MKQVQATAETNPDPPGIESTVTLEIQPNHVHCGNRDYEKETKISLVINMLRTDLEFEVPLQSNYYQIENPN